MRPFSAQGRQATALRTQFKGPPSHPSKAAPIGGIRKRNRRHQNETQGLVITLDAGLTLDKYLCPSSVYLPCEGQEPS